MLLLSHAREQLSSLVCNNPVLFYSEMQKYCYIYIVFNPYEVMQNQRCQLMWTKHHSYIVVLKQNLVE